MSGKKAKAKRTLEKLDAIENGDFAQAQIDMVALKGAQQAAKACQDNIKAIHDDISTQLRDAERRMQKLAKEIQKTQP